MSDSKQKQKVKNLPKQKPKAYIQVCFHCEPNEDVEGLWDIFILDKVTGEFLARFSTFNLGAVNALINLNAILHQYDD